MNLGPAPRPDPASAALTAAAPLHQRSRGALRLAFKQRDSMTVLDALRQEGCLKIRFPSLEQAAWKGAVTLNTAGGIAGGDQLSTRIEAGPGTAATIASQAAERIYRALPGAVASISTHLHVAPGAALEWLPQETILFDRCAARRRLHVELASDARFLGVEQLVFGRTAMGETVGAAAFHDLIQLRRDGRLILHDAIRLDGPVQSLLDHAATANGARAIATLVHASPNAARLLGPLRTALAPWEAGASAWDGMLVARVVAADGACLRRAVVAGLNVLRDARPLPRVWQC